MPVSEPLPGHPLTSVPPEERAARASVTCERRRVHGRLLWGGLPLPDRLVTFEQAGADPVQAWDLTGDQGDYDVLLSPGRYALALDGRPAPGLEVLVPPSPDEAQMKGLELDLILRRAPTPEDR